MAPYNRALALKIIADGDPRIEHPDSRDTLEAIRRTVIDLQCEAARSGDAPIMIRED